MGLPGQPGASFPSAAPPLARPHCKILEKQQISNLAPAQRSHPAEHRLARGTALGSRREHACPRAASPAPRAGGEPGRAATAPKAGTSVSHVGSQCTQQGGRINDRSQEQFPSHRVSPLGGARGSRLPGGRPSERSQVTSSSTPAPEISATKGESRRSREGEAERGGRADLSFRPAPRTRGRRRGGRRDRGGGTGAGAGARGPTPHPVLGARRPASTRPRRRPRGNLPRPGLTVRRPRGPALRTHRASLQKGRTGQAVGHSGPEVLADAAPRRPWRVRVWVRGTR